MSIQVEHIEKRFNQFAALHDINITFPSGNWWRCWGRRLW